MEWWMQILLVVGLVIGFVVLSIIWFIVKERIDAAQWEAKHKRETQFTASEARAKLHKRVRVKQSNALVSAGTVGTVIGTTSDHKVVISWHMPPTAAERFAYDGQWYDGYQEEPETKFDKGQYYRWLQEI